MTERNCAGVEQRRKRQSVHVCYVNACMIVHSESIQECVVFFVLTTAREWVNAHVHERSAWIHNIRQAQRCNSE